MAVIARDLTEAEWSRIQSERAAEAIVGGEFPSYPLTDLANEVVRLRRQLAGAVEALEAIREAITVDGRPVSVRDERAVAIIDAILTTTGGQ